MNEYERIPMEPLVFADLIHIWAENYEYNDELTGFGDWDYHFWKVASVTLVCKVTLCNLCMKDTSKSVRQTKYFL